MTASPAVRTRLRNLEDKGHVRHVAEGPRYVYEPAVSSAVERRSVLRHLVYTFFDGSTEAAMTALFPALADFTVKATVLLVITAGVARLLRRAVKPPESSSHGSRRRVPAGPRQR